MYNFAENNSLPAVAKTVTELRYTLKSESEVVINSFKNNKMIASQENSKQLY